MARGPWVAHPCSRWTKRKLKSSSLLYKLSNLLLSLSTAFKTWFNLSVTSVVDVLLLLDSFTTEHFVSTVEFSCCFLTPLHFSHVCSLAF